MKSIILISFMLCISTSYSQVNCLDNNITYCEIDSSSQVFDYFNQRTDTLFCEYGRTILMDCLPYFRDRKPTYVIRKSTYVEEFNGYGLLDVFIENKLLFRYEMLNGEIEGTGTIYYPGIDRVAYQGTFKNGKLNGILFCLSKDDSEVIHSMLFRNGKPKKILYVWNIKQSKKEYKKINKRKYFKNGKCTSIIEYPFAL